MSEHNARPNSGNIALGGILSECNTFSINLMTKELFKRYEYFENKQILNLQSGIVGGMSSVLDDSTLNVSPTVFASCSTGGVIKVNVI